VRLLTAHKILVGAALGLSAILVVWGLSNRGQPGAYLVLALGAAALLPGALYLRKLRKNPPIR
jgi:hypothetical protein